MAIRATCDGCFMEYKVPSDRAGKAFKCKDCGGAVRVPRPGQSSESAPQTAPPPRQRASAPARRSKKKTSTTKSGGSVLPLGIAAAAVVVVGVIGYQFLPKGDAEKVAGEGGLSATSGAESGGQNGAALSSSGENARDASPVTDDEAVILSDFRQMMRSQVKESPAQRKAAMDKFAADRNMTPEDVLAIAEKDRQARTIASRVDSNWKPLQISSTGPRWPASTDVNVTAATAGALYRIPQVRTPFVLASATGSGGTQRRVFDLTQQKIIGEWTNKIIPNHMERVSPNGRLVALQEGFSAPITLHIVDVESGEIKTQITSPDIHKISTLAFTNSQHLLIITTLSSERTRDKTRRCLIFDATTGMEASRFERELHFVGNEEFSLSPDGRYLLMSGKGKSIEVVEVATGEQVCAIDLASEGIEFGQIHSVAFSPDGRKIAVLEQRPLVALRLYVIDAGTGDIAQKADLYGATTNIGAPLELQQSEPLVWFLDSRYFLIGKLLAVDSSTGRRVWHAQGQQIGNSTFRLPAQAGLLYQVNSSDSSELVPLPIDFDRVAATQSAWPADAALSPAMTVSVSVDLSAAGLDEVAEPVATGMKAKLQRLGFTVADNSDRTLTIGMQDGAVSFTWRSGSDILWQSVATSDSAMVPQLGHLKGKTLERAVSSEGIVKLQAYPVPYFIANDGWTLPIVDRIEHSR